MVSARRAKCPSYFEPDARERKVVTGRAAKVELRKLYLECGGRTRGDRG
jgi:hypothetical protein